MNRVRGSFGLLRLAYASCRFLERLKRAHPPNTGVKPPRRRRLQLSLRRITRFALAHALWTRKPARLLACTARSTDRGPRRPASCCRRDIRLATFSCSTLRDSVGRSAWRVSRWTETSWV